MLCCVIRVGGENGENFKMKRERERDSDPLKCSQNLCVMKYHFELNRESVCSLKKKKRRRDVDNVPLPTPFWTFELGQKR